MFKAIQDLTTLWVVALRMRDIENIILRGERLTDEEEKYLRLSLLGIDSRRDFRDEEHRDRLIKEWWRGAKIHYKRLKKVEEEERRRLRDER